MLDVVFAPDHEDDVVVAEGGVVAGVGEGAVGALDRDDGDAVLAADSRFAEGTPITSRGGWIVARAKSSSTDM